MAKDVSIFFSGVQFDIVDGAGKTLTPKELVRKLDELNWGSDKSHL